MMNQYASQVLHMVGLAIEESKKEIKHPNGKKHNIYNYKLVVLNQKLFKSWNESAKKHLECVPAAFLSEINAKYLGKKKKRKLNNIIDDAISQQMANNCNVYGNNSNVNNKKQSKTKESNSIFSNLKNNDLYKNLYEKSINKDKKKKEEKKIDSN